MRKLVSFFNGPRGLVEQRGPIGLFVLREALCLQNSIQVLQLCAEIFDRAVAKVCRLIVTLGEAVARKRG